MDADFTRWGLLLDRSHNKIDSDRDTISHMGDGRQTPDRRETDSRSETIPFNRRISMFTF